MKISIETAEQIRRFLAPTWVERVTKKLNIGGANPNGWSILFYVLMVLVSIAAIVGFAALIYGANAYALYYLWNNFAAPISHITLTLKECFGLLILLAFIRGRRTKSSDDKDSKEKSKTERFAKLTAPILFPASCIAFGWIILHMV